MIVKTINLPRIKPNIEFKLVEPQSALIMPVGDIHYGADGFPERKLVDHFQWGMDRGALFIGMGEYLDFASYSQRAIMQSTRDSNRQLLDQMVEHATLQFFRLIKFTKGRWLGMIEGDHRWTFLNGQSSDQLLCRELGCDFLGTSAMLRLHSSKVPRRHPEADCTLYVHHGIGTARRAGAALARVEDLLIWLDADIYLMGHAHQKISAPIDRQYITPDGKHYHQTKLLARTGAWLRGYKSHEPLSLDRGASESRGSYVEQKALAPASLGGLCIGIGYEQIHDSKYYRPLIHYSV